MVIYWKLEEALFLSMHAVSYLSGVICLQWLLFHHIYPLPLCKLSKNMLHQNLYFCSLMQILGPDLNIFIWDQWLQTFLPLLPHYIVHVGWWRYAVLYPKYPWWISHYLRFYWNGWSWWVSFQREYRAVHWEPGSLLPYDEGTTKMKCCGIIVTGYCVQ